MRLGLICAACALAGCDVIFGVTGEVVPCELAAGAFDEAMPVQLMEAEELSLSADRTIAVVQSRGLPLEVHLDGANLVGEPLPIDLGVHPVFGLSFAAEGDALFYSSPIEPVVLRGAVRDDRTGVWLLGRTVPRAATFAGTPSADDHGPRRVIVRARDTDTTVHELEDQDGVWTPVGDPHELNGLFAPNLTPSGLTMVWSGLDGLVLAADRASTSDWFGEPRVILGRPARAPQLFGDFCQTMFASENGQLVRISR